MKYGSGIGKYVLRRRREKKSETLRKFGVDISFNLLTWIGSNNQSELPNKIYYAKPELYTKLLCDWEIMNYQLLLSDKYSDDIEDWPADYVWSKT